MRKPHATIEPNTPAASLRGAAKGISRSQARGHPKPSEAAITSKRPPRPIEDERLQLAFKVLRQEKSLSAAARAAKISPERLRHFATKETSSSARAADGSSGTNCRAACCSFRDGRPSKWSSATSRRRRKIGRFMSAVSHFLRTNNPAGLREFEGVSVTDVSGRTHPFETRPNALYRLASAHDQSFEHIYRIVV